jgi:RHS repeat-associated protein
MSNHLGNVMVVVSDRKVVQTDSTYLADLVSTTDYYAFGMVMADRSYNTEGYRFGFKGKENDNEVKGTGNQQDYGMRIYDPRLGRFLSVDPLFQKFPMLSAYQFASNTPIQAIDLDGLEALVVYMDHFAKETKISTKFDQELVSMGADNYYMVHSSTLAL